MTLHPPLQKCARKPVSWRTYLPAGHDLAAIVNFASLSLLTPAHCGGRLAATMNSGAHTRGKITIGKPEPSATVIPWSASAAARRSMRNGEESEERHEEGRQEENGQESRQEEEEGGTTSTYWQHWPETDCLKC